MSSLNGNRLEGGNKFTWYETTIIRRTLSFLLNALLNWLINR